MSAESKAIFSQLMDDLGVIYDKPISVQLKRLYWEDLEHLQIEVIESAIKKHRRDPERGRFFPKPADILEKAGAGVHQRPNADEAWAIALGAFDESNTVCASDEILEALQAASAVWNTGDKIGARMAFKGAYDRIVDARRATGTKPVWQLSLGWDSEKRARAAQDAVRAGFLAKEDVRDFLPLPPKAGAVAAVAGLLAGKTNVVEFPTDRDAITRMRIQQLRDALEKPKVDEETRRAEQAAQERAALERQKREALAAVGMCL